MGTTAFHRPARMYPPAVPDQKVTLAQPPQRPTESAAQQWLYLLLPLLSSVSMGAYLVTFGKTWMILLGVGFIVVSVGVTAIVRWQSRRTGLRNQARQRGRYREYLADLRLQARESAAVQRAAATFAHPGPQRLWAVATAGRRVWERRPDDADFLELRVGLGRADAAMRLILGTSNDPTVDHDRASLKAVSKLVADHATVASQPAWVGLGRIGVLSVLGPADRTRAVAAGLLTQLAVLHSPDDVTVIALIGDEHAWSWLKWLPHTRDPAGTPLVARHLDGLADVLEAQLEKVRADRAATGGIGLRRDRKPDRHVVILLDGYRPDAAFGRHPLIEALLAESGADVGVHLVCLVGREADEPGRVDARIRVEADGALSLDSRLPTDARTPPVVSAVTDAVADPADVVLNERIARALAPLRLSGEREQVLTRTVSLPGMLGLGEIGELDPAAHWRAADDPSLLRVPVGITGEGADLVLDLKESAQGGVGPHGLLIGATGSGKSEFLRTLVTGLAVTHSPEELGMVLVDFKGGATFAGVTELPHVAGLITNLSEDLGLVDRMRVALHGEQQRRQQLLRDAGNTDSVREYQLLRARGGTDAEGRPLPPMPYLMIFVDEFGELLTQRPDFLGLFVQIGRLGRSLGMHLLLSSQRFDEGRLRGLESHLSYRICLRAFSAAESRAVIGTTDAYKLPPIPGSAYFKVGETVYERFRVAHVSAPYTAPDPDGSQTRTETPALLPFALRTAEDARRASETPDPETDTLLPVRAQAVTGQTTELQVIVDRIRPLGPPVHQVWLPPLPPVIELESLFGTLETDPERGFHATDWPGGQLAFPVGVIDLPARQEQRVLALRIEGGHGHIALVGGPQTGKSMLLRTAVLGAMLTHTPAELQFTVLDYGGGSLGSLAGAPHVTGVAGRTDEERTRRALAVAHRQLAAREELFQRLGIDSVAEFRRRREAGELPDGVNAADQVLVIDNWAAVRAAVEAADQIVTDISARGLGVGLHLMLAANRWQEVRVNLRDNIGGRLELRLNEPGESEISRPVAKAVARIPGRGISPPGDLFQAALPRLDGTATLDGLAQAQLAAVTALASGWTGPVAPPLRVLPAVLTPAELDAAVGELDEAPAGVAVGLRENDLRPAVLDLNAREPHFVVLGDSGSGKTSFLRAWMSRLTATLTPKQARFFVLDYRGGLLDVVPEEYLGARAGNSDHAAAYVAQLVDTLNQRRPPADITAAELRARTWWTGPDIYLVADDYDLVAGAGISRGPLGPLAELLGQAGDIGLHLVLARRVSGASRALMSDPMLSRLREYGSGGLILSGDPREGVLLGDQRAARRAPGRGVLFGRSMGAQVVQTVLAEDGPGGR